MSKGITTYLGRLFRRDGKKQEVLIEQREDRRLLSSVPDPDHIRSGDERRQGVDAGARFIAKFAVSIHQLTDAEVTVDKQVVRQATAVDISDSGLLVELTDTQLEPEASRTYRLRFTVPPGSMPEGYESTFRLNARLVRKYRDEEGRMMAAFSFERPLSTYLRRRRWRFSIYTASAMMFVAALVVVLMRMESIIYFKYDYVLYLYSLIAAGFLLSRYLFGALHRDVPINPDFTPGVSIVIPCFNEEQWIHRTIQSCMNQDYPVDKLEVIIVDDRSTDGSVERMKQVIARLHEEGERFGAKERLKMLVLSENKGKREALVAGVNMAKHDLVVFVDSDSFLAPDAIRNLVQPFQDPKTGGVAGRTDVENRFTNTMTKLQAVRYYVAFRIMKAAESYFDSVTCLSGPLSCYRKDLVLRYADDWLNQRFLGQPATFGDDRAMTNFVLRTHRTAYQDTAVCATIVPSDTKVFLRQQMRWKRSWLRESLIAGTFIWRKEPFMALFFYVGLLVPIAAPVIVLYNLVYVPLIHGVFPGTFLMGLLLMALLMSFAHLFFKRSRLWIYGIVFCLYYEAVLLWQMPIAWVTFWKSTWGTRETVQDVEAKQRKMNRKRRKPGLGL